MEDKFNLKSWSIGFEVPFFDPNDSTGAEELSKNLASRYCNWFDVLKVDLSIIELPSTNRLLLYSIVVRVDNEYTSKDTLDSDWDHMKSQVENDLKSFVELHNTNYRILTEK